MVKPAINDPRRLGARITEGVDGWTIALTGNDLSADGHVTSDGRGVAAVASDGLAADSEAGDHVTSEDVISSDVAADDILLRDATELLRAELPDARLADDTAYLRWCYRDNPLGRAWERYHYIDGPDGEPLLVAHYLNMPRRYRGPSGEHSDGAWSQHAVTRSGYQRARHFTRLGLEIYGDAGTSGRSFVVGVTNDKSIGPVVKYMGWRLIGPLPVRVVFAFGVKGLVWRRNRLLRTTEVTQRWLSSSDFDDFAAMVNRHAVAGWSTDWTPEVLRWRLCCPFTRYWVHISDDVAAITTTTRHFGLPATVVLKLFPLGAPPPHLPQKSGARVAATGESDGSARVAATGLSGGSARVAATGLSAAPSRVDATALIAAIARQHRSLFGVYAGFNGSVRVRGMIPPRRLQPSPLNLIIRSLQDDVDQNQLMIDTFELLDMDAY